MKSFLLACAAASSLLMAAPALAGSADGRIQVKVLATAVLPDGKITSVNTNLVGAPAGTQTFITDNYTPTVAIEYFFTPNFSVETIAGVTKHDVRGAGAIAGARLIRNAHVVPATVTAKLHFDLGGVKPYVGAGPAYFLYFGEDVDTGARALGATDVNLREEFGVALQAGVDVPLNARGLSLTADAKRYFINTRADFSAGGRVALSTDHRVSPWVLSAGLAYRF